MASKKTNIKTTSKSGKGSYSKFNAFQKKEEEKQIVEVLERREMQEAELLARKVTENVSKLSNSTKMQLIYTLRNSIDEELDKFERKIQTEVTLEQKKEKYRNLFDENGYGMISRTTGIYYMPSEGEGGEELGEEEVHIDDVDWKNVTGTINTEEYGEIPVVLVRNPVFSFFSESDWEKRKDWKKDIHKNLDYLQNLKGEEPAGIYKIRDLLKMIQDDIDSYERRGGNIDDLKEEQEEVIKFRKKFNIW